MNRLSSITVLLGCVLLAVSCSQQQVQPVKKPVKSPVYVGRVDRVYPRHNYVLIALAGTVYEPGTVLISQSGNSSEDRRVANLIVTEERMGRTRIPADIRSGTAEPGDLVFLYQDLAAPESSVQTKQDEHPDAPEPSKEITPPISPEGGVTRDGLLPLPGQSAEPQAPVQEPAGQDRTSPGREKVLEDLDTVPATLEDSLRAFAPEKKAGK